MAKLSVNINKIATLRNSRGGGEPHVLQTALKIVAYGADGITIHPRADKRHITPQDVKDIALKIKNVETNFEGDIREEFLTYVLEYKPSQCTLVPVKPGEVTSNHGWDTLRWDFLLAPIIAKIKKHEVRVSPGNADIVKRASDIGADRLEIYTEPYAAAFLRGDYTEELKKIAITANAAAKYNLGLNAGHDLTIANLPALMKCAPNLLEVSIGHHLICYALEVGLKNAISEYLAVAHGFQPSERLR